MFDIVFGIIDYPVSCIFLYVSYRVKSILKMVHFESLDHN